MVIRRIRSSRQSACCPFTQAETVSSAVANRIACCTGFSTFNDVRYANFCSLLGFPLPGATSGFAIHTDGAFRTAASSAVSHPIHSPRHALLVQQPRLPPLRRARRIRLSVRARNLHPPPVPRTRLHRRPRILHVQRLSRRSPCRCPTHPLCRPSATPPAWPPARDMLSAALRGPHPSIATKTAVSHRQSPAGACRLSTCRCTGPDAPPCARPIKHLQTTPTPTQPIVRMRSRPLIRDETTSICCNHPAPGGDLNDASDYNQP